MDFPEVRARFRAAGLETISWLNPDEFWLPHPIDEATPIVMRVGYEYLASDRTSKIQVPYQDRILNFDIASACTAKRLPTPSSRIKFEASLLKKHLDKWDSELIPVVQAVEPYAVYDSIFDIFRPNVLENVQSYKPVMTYRVASRCASKVLLPVAGILLLPFRGGLEDQMQDMIFGGL